MKQSQVAGMSAASRGGSRGGRWLTLAAKWVTPVALVCGTSLLAAPSSFAREPLPEARLKVRVELKSSTSGEVVIQNDEDDAAQVDVSPAHASLENTLSSASVHPPIKPIHLGIAGHQESRGPFEFEAPKNGVMVIHFQTRVTLGNRRVKNGPMVYQVYKVTPTGLKETTYEDAFLGQRVVGLKPQEKSQSAELKLGGGFVSHVSVEKLAFKAHVMEAAQAGQIQAVKLGSPIDMANKFKLKEMPAVGGREKDGSGHLEAMEGLEANAPAALDSRESMNLVTGFSLEDGVQPEEDSLMSSFTIKGHLSTKYNDGSFHGAWGWVVTAWQYENSTYTALGWTYVNGDGSWQIPLASVATNQTKVYVQYQTANRFVQLQDPSGNVYTWGDWWTLSGGTTDIGYRFADLSTSGDLPGIDKLYEGATDEWSKFYANGMNALRDQPIQVTYPNSLASGHCIESTDGSGNKVAPYAWSCSEWSDGKIWIIPAHGDKSVVQHEAAHSINSYYWNGNLPSGAGGTHSLDGCYNGGLALSEGFADFIAYWVQFDRSVTSASASYFNEDIEAYAGDNNCSSGDINEMRVAANMWDMYDTHNDGPDTTHYDGWAYNNQASPVSIYLSNGTQQKESDYLSIVDAGDSTWFAADRALFRLNKIIP